MKKANLLSTTACSTICKQLDKHLPMDWDTVFTYVTAMTMESLREGEPVQELGKAPVSTIIEYTLTPLLEKNQPTTIYAPGGSVKSYLADYIACLVQFGAFGLGDVLIPDTSCNVLYLDWEACFEDHRRRVWFIKRGLEIDTDEIFFYRFCNQSLANDIYSIQKIVDARKIGLVIVDSQGAASGSGPDASANANQFYNALRSLRCTSLTIDHISKAAWQASNDGADSTGPIGPVTKFNRSRSQFEIKKSQTPGESFVEISVTHRKHNNGKLLKPFGIKVNFNDDENGHLDKVTFESCDVTDNPELAKSLSVPERIVAILKASREPMTVKSLSERMDKDAGQIRVRLNELKDKGVVASREVGKDTFWAMVYHDK
jgi:hypothetical protein